MTLYDFDERALVRALRALPRESAALFAAAAAARQVANYEKHAGSIEGNDGRIREIVRRLREAAGNANPDVQEWRATLEEVMTRMPGEESGSEGAVFADHALAALAYAIRCLLNGDAQESAWAARRAYEAADQAAIRILDIDLATPGAEAALGSHAVVQRELERQQRDIVSLQAGSIHAVREHAARDELLTREEQVLVGL